MLQCKHEFCGSAIFRGKTTNSTVRLEIPRSAENCGSYSSPRSYLWCRATSGDRLTQNPSNRLRGGSTSYFPHPKANAPTIQFHSFRLIIKATVRQKAVRFHHQLRPLYLNTYLHEKSWLVTCLGSHRTGRYQASFDQLVRIVSQDLSIFARSRFSFISIHNQISWPKN